MALHKMVNGVEVECTPEEEAEILGEWKVKAESEAATAYIESRMQQYPKIGDQLDAIWKLIAAVAIDGRLAIPAESAEVLAKIQEVKETNPKPTVKGEE